MSNKKKPWRGAGGSEGKASQPASPSATESDSEPEEQTEIPIGTPVSADELQRLKRAAERHSDLDDEERRTQSDST